MRRALLVVGLVGCCRIGAAEGTLSPAVLEEERRERARDAAGYETAVVHPFVLVSQAGPVRAEAEVTIAWARDRLRGDFFDKEPGKPITMFVFGDEASYRSGSSALLDIVPDTPYGFFRPCKRALVVNAGYGWGTLVHEMVHAYVAADFPSAPTWLNEGLGSLFEMPIEVDGHIRGATNWRLPELQQAIRAGRALSIEETTSGGTYAFYLGKRTSLYYASARYLLYWLQERGLLRELYRTFRQDSRGDGLPALKAVTKTQDLAALRRVWEADVLALTYRREDHGRGASPR